MSWTYCDINVNDMDLHVVPRDKAGPAAGQHLGHTKPTVVVVLSGITRLTRG